MTYKDSNSHFENPTGLHPESEPDSKRDKRRSFLKTALVSAPLIVTVSSKPVWANICTVSGMMSGNASYQGQEVTCQGCTPGRWRNKGYWGKEWPSRFVESGYQSANIPSNFKNLDNWQEMYDYTKNVNDVFGNLFTFNGSMLEALWIDGGVDELLFHAIAGVLNAEKFGQQHFGYTVETFIAYIEHHINDTDPDIITQLSILNERDCPFDYD